MRRSINSKLFFINQQKAYLGFVEENDSSIIFTRKSSSILKAEKKLFMILQRRLEILEAK